MGAPELPDGPELVYLKGMKGHDFEDLVYEVYQRHGYQVIRMPRVRDGGKDLVVVQGNNRYYVQCKRWKRKVGVRQVRELDSVSTHDGAVGSIIVTTKSFTRPAMEYAKNLATPMMLIGGDQFAQMADQVGIQLDWGSRAEEEVIRCFPRQDDLTWGALEAKLERMAPSSRYPGHQDIMLGPQIKAYYRLDFTISRYPRKHRSAEVNHYALIDGSATSLPEDTSWYLIEQRPELAKCFGGPVGRLREWRPHEMERSLIIDEFNLPQEEARKFGQWYGQQLAKGMKLPPSKVVLRKVYKLMIPLYTMQRVVGNGSFEVCALLGREPYHLSYITNGVPP
jgi:hypothetical protein